MFTWLWLLFSFSVSAQETSFQDLSTPSTQALPANPYAQCGSEKTDKTSWSYCIYRYENHSQKVVYHFHGILGDEREWERVSEKTMLERWKATGQQPPVIVSISFGKTWFLAEKNSSSLSGLFELYNQKIFPRLQTLLGFVPEQNILLGYSMGGLNASILYFKMPQVFTRAALICGAMATVSPHASKQEVEDYIERTQAERWRVMVALALSRTYFPTEEAWQKHSPVSLATTLTPLSAPIYMSNGLSDEFGFQEGNLAFVTTAQNNGASIESQFYPKNGHCQVDLKPIADFIVDAPILL